MPSALSDPPSSVGPSRRNLLRGGLLGLAALTVAGCSGGRVRTPWSPDPDTDDELPANLPPDGELLLLALDRVHRYRTQLGQVGPRSRGQRSAVRHLTSVWQVQQERLEQLLTLAGVELPALDEVPALAPGSTDAESGAATASPGGTGGGARAGTTSSAAGQDDAAGTSAPPGPDVSVLGERVRTDLPTALAELARSTATNRAVLTSLLAQHAESARLLEAPVAWTPLAGPVGAAAVPVLQVTRPAVFGLEVVAARSGGEERELFESVLGPLRRITRALTTLAQDAAPVPPLGYDLPEPLDDAEARLELARALVHDVAPAALSVVDRAGSDEPQLQSLVRIVAESSQWSRDLGVTGAPFPGMSLP